MTISKNKGIFSSPVLDGKEDSPSPFWCSKKPFARLVFLCYFEGTVPSGVQTPAPLKEACWPPVPPKTEFHPECKLRLH